MSQPPGAVLWHALMHSHTPWGIDVDHAAPGGEYHLVGDGTGEVGFIREYALVGWKPDANIAKCSREALTLLEARLRSHGDLILMVYWRNYRCIKVVRKLGAIPLGVDDNQFFHYRLTLEGFRYGQEVATARAT